MDTKKISLNGLYNDAVAKEFGFTMNEKLAEQVEILINTQYTQLAAYVLQEMSGKTSIGELIDVIKSYGATILYRERMGEHKCQE